MGKLIFVTAAAEIGPGMPPLGIWALHQPSQDKGRWVRLTLFVVLTGLVAKASNTAAPTATEYTRAFDGAGGQRTE